MKTAYFDCFSGISGDMTLGALVDVGVPPDTLKAELAKLRLDEFSLRFEKAIKHGITGTRAIVETTVNSSPNMGEQSHEHNQPHAESIEVSQPAHRHENAHDGNHHHEHHRRRDAHEPSRHLSDIFAILEGSNLEDTIITRAKRIFDRLAEAEAKVHNMPKDQVHLHEVSGIDSIVDIVGAVIGLHLLEIDEIYASPLSLGGGFVRCAHGLMPVPAPGTMELLRGVPVRQTEVRKELVTPTGAAIITTLARGFGCMSEMIIDRIGYGAGARDLDEHPNLLRIVVGEKETLTIDRDFASLNLEEDEVYLVETNLDDMSPEITGYVMEKLFEQGALDVFLTPIFMKKGRPATKLSVLSTLNLRNTLIETLLTETTTFGVRCYRVERFKLSRDFIEVETRWGVVRTKRGYSGDRLIKVVPEYEDCKRLAEQNRIPLHEIYEETIRCFD